jgi:hypothetical protein
VQRRGIANVYKADRLVNDRIGAQALNSMPPAESRTRTDSVGRGETRGAGALPQERAARTAGEDAFFFVDAVGEGLLPITVRSAPAPATPGPVVRV